MKIVTKNSIYQLGVVAGLISITKIEELAPSPYFKIGEPVIGNSLFLAVGRRCELYDKESGRCKISTSIVQELRP